jgi:N-acyl-D-amino-acid deacylase
MAAFAARLGDPWQRRQMRQAVTTVSGRWENLYLASGGAEGIVVLPAIDGPVARYRGLTLREAAERRGGEDPVDTLLALVELEPALPAAYFMMNEDSLRMALGRPWISIGSDAATFATEPVYSVVATHPRAYGTFARILGVYVRELPYI